MAVPVKLTSREQTANHNPSKLYERDTYGWAMQQAEALRRRDLGSIDWENVIEEIEDVGKRDKRSWTSSCAQAIAHLLKIEYWELADESDLRHWMREIRTFRSDMGDTIMDSPGLKGSYSEMFRTAWRKGRFIAKVTLADYEVDGGASASERDLGRRWDRVLPRECPYSLDEVAAYDPRREPEPRDEWPASVAEVLTLRLGVKYHPVEPASNRPR